MDRCKVLEHFVRRLKPTGWSRLAILIWSLFPAAWGQSLEPVVISGIQSPPGRILTGSRVELSVLALGEGPLFYFWFRNGEFIEDIFDPILVLDPFDETMAGTYDALVVNEFGVAIANTAELVPEIASLPFTDGFDARPGGQGLFPNRIVGREGSGRGSNVGATFQRRAGEPDHAGFPGGRSVWVSWTADATGIAAFGTEGSAFDTVLAVYRARDPVRPALDSLIELTANDDSEFGSTTGLPAEPSSLVLFNVQAGTTYYIAVDGFGIAGDTGPLLDELSVSGNIVLSWTMEPTNEQIPDFLTEFSDLNVDPGGGLSLDARVETSNADRTEWQWFFEEQPLLGVNASQIDVQNVSRGQVGTYFCETRNVYGNDVRSTRSTAVDLQIAERSDGVDKTIQAEDRFVDARRARLGPGGRGFGATAASGRPGHRQGLAAGSSGTQIFSTRSAGKDAAEPVHCGLGGGRSKWFTIDPTENGILTADTQGSDFDTVLAVYIDNGLGVGLFDGLVAVGCNNDFPGLGKASRVAVSATAGTTYYLAVDGIREAVGVAQLNFSLQKPLTITRQPLAQTVAPGSPAQFSVIASGIGSLKYQWRKSGQAITGATQAELRIPSASLADAGDYTVVITDDVTTATSIPVSLTVAHPAPLKLSLSRLSPTELVIRGAPPAGEMWRIESSRDLKIWEAVVTVTATATGFEVKQALIVGSGGVAFRAVKR